MKDCKIEKSKYLELENDGLQYLDTKDDNLIQKFLEVRKYVYSLKPVTQKSLAFNEGWNYGMDTHVIMVMDKDKCVGGAIFIINDCSTDLFFPPENENFRLKFLFPEYQLDKNIHAFFKSFVILPQYANWKCSANIFRCIYNLCVKNGVKFLFATPHLSAAKVNKISLKKLKLDLLMEIKDNIKLSYEDRWNGYERKLLVIYSQEFLEPLISENIKFLEISVVS